MSSKKKNDKKVTPAEKKQLELTKKALMGHVPSLKELEKQLGPGEFARRCEKLLKAIFEPNGRTKGRSAREIKESARKCVEKSHELYRQSCEEFFKALDELYLLSTIADGEPVLGEQKKAKPPKTSPKPASGPKADKAKLDTAVEKHIEESRPQHHTRLPASVRLTPHEIALNLGSFMTRELAQRDATELLTFARVIWNRSTVFPAPSRYGVQPHVEAAQPVKRSDKRFSAPWTVNATIAISGDDKKCEAWGQNVYARNRSEQE